VSDSPIQELTLLLVLIALNAFFAASEMAVVTVNKIRLHQKVEQGNKTARIVERLATESSRFLATIQVGVTMIGFLAAATAAVSLTEGVGNLLRQIPVPIIQASANGIAVILITVLLALIMLLFGELVPKNVALKHAERIAFAVARPVDWLARIFAPLVCALVWLTNKISALLGADQTSTMPFVTQDEIRAMVDAGEEGGVIEEEEKEMIFSIFDFGDTLAREVMVPRIDITAVDVNTPLMQALDVIMKEGHSRVPVYQKSIDNIIGLLYAKDLLVYLKEAKQDVPLKSILRPAYFVPETKKVDELLRELQARRVHMAIVVDEYGGTAGLVTVEDLLEEIVGEIQDEYDAEEPSVEQAPEGGYIFDAGVQLDEVNELLDANLPDSGGDTLGGFIYGQLGRVAAVGDKIQMDGLVVSVVSVSGRRIRKVHVAQADAPPGAGNDSSR
jgi:putative hemolysin